MNDHELKTEVDKLYKMATEGKAVRENHSNDYFEVQRKFSCELAGLRPDDLKAVAEALRPSAWDRWNITKSMQLGGIDYDASGNVTGLWLGSGIQRPYRIYGDANINKKFCEP